MSSSEASPRWATPRTPERPNRLDRFVWLAKQLGLTLMPHQRLIAEVGSEYDRTTGTPFYREVICTVPRQSGKSIEVLLWELDRGMMWGSPQRIVYTAQTGWDARRKLVDDHAPLLQAHLPAAIKRVLRGSGNESIIFADKFGSRIDVQASSPDAGHGRTLDLAVIDEAFADTDDRREQALLPAMATKPKAQLLVFSTAGDQTSTYLRRKVDAGRAAVESGKREGIAYFEWSAHEDDDPDDRAVWRRCMPALGHTITEGVVAHARETMSDGEFRRAYLNQWVSYQEQLISTSDWQAVNSVDVRVDGRRAFGVSASVDRDWASIVVADSSGRLVVVEHRSGLSWLLGRLLELWERWRAPIAVDSGDPAGFLIGRLADRKVEVKKYAAQSYAQACGVFFDRVSDGSVAVFPDEALDQAVGAASKRSLGEAWAWSRKSNVDISPLIAATLALDAAAGLPPPRPRVVNLNDF